MASFLNLYYSEKHKYNSKKIPTQTIDRSWITTVGVVGGTLFSGTVIVLLLGIVIRRRQRVRLTTVSKNSG